MTTEPATSRVFSEASTRQTLAEACSAVGLSSGGAQLLRVGENAIYALSNAGVVVRIARSLGVIDDVRKEIRVARWLEEQEFPSARLSEQTTDDALIVDGYPVTFWKFVHSVDPRPGNRDLGQILRALHDTPISAGLDLPAFDPFSRVADRLDAAPAEADTRDVEFLSELFEESKGAYTDLRYDFPPGPVHGDAHRGNLMRAASGEVVLLDFEAFAYGQREWDLSVTGAGYQGFQWISQESYREFSDAYGYDILSWSGFHVCRAIRELTMTTWLMQLTGDRSAAREFRRRVDDLRSGTFPRDWRAF